MVVQMVAGMFAGVVLASIGWGIYLQQAKSKKGKEQQIREELMHELGELWVDVDSVISSFRSGMMDERTFKNTVSSKIESVNHILKPNLHLFEVYFIKYMETLIKEYTRMVHHKEGAALSTATDFASEMETSFALSQPEQTDSSMVSAEALKQKEGDTNVKQGISTDTTISEPVRNIPTTSAGVSGEVDTMFEATFNAFSSAEVPQKSAAPTPDKAESEPASKEAMPATEAFSFEGKFADEDAADADEEVTDETIIGFDQHTLFSKLKKDSPDASGLLGSKTSGIMDEDFTMETLMDVDISTISSITKTQPKKSTASDDVDTTRHFELIGGNKEVSLTGKTELEIVIASDAAHAEKGTKEKEPVPPPEETKFNRLEVVESSAQVASEKGASEVDEDFEVIIPDRTAAADALAESTGVPEGSAGKSDESESITGDDVANTIAALENSAASVREKSAAPVKEAKPETKHEAKPDKKAAATAPATAKKPGSLKESEEAITGDDVADQIDSFFGLFQ